MLDVFGMSVCNFPPVRVVCPNHEVVLLKPWIVTRPHIGYVAIITYLSSPPTLTDYTIFLDH